MLRCSIGRIDLRVRQSGPAMTDRNDIIGDGERAMISPREIETLYRSRKRLMLTAARGLLEARLADELLRSPYAPLSRNERASLISVARNEKRLAKFRHRVAGSAVADRAAGDEGGLTAMTAPSTSRASALGHWPQGGTPAGECLIARFKI